jgi:hypothetical protein
LNDAGALFGVHREAENEKEDKRKEIVEEEDRPVSKRELQVDPQEREECFHSSVAVALWAT